MRTTIGCTALGLAALAMLMGCPDSRTAGDRGNTMRETYVYTVRPEDRTMTDVSVRVYGSDQFADELAAANPAVNPDRLQAGETLTIPEAQMGDKTVAPRGCDRIQVYYGPSPR